MSWKDVKKTMLNICDKHGSEILAGVGVAGIAVTAFLASKATLKCSEVLKEGNLTPVEKAKEVLPDYIPAIISGLFSGYCIVLSKKIDFNKNAALAAAATLSETALREYKAKAIEVLGEQGEKKISDAIAKQKIEDNPVTSSEVIVTGKGKHRFFDSISGRYFQSDVESVRRSINDLNARLMSEMYITLDELYYEIGLPSIWIGNVLGWNIENGTIVPQFSTHLCDDGEPAVVLNFVNMPKCDYK